MGIVLLVLLLTLMALNRWLANKASEHQKEQDRKNRLPGYPYTSIDEE